MTFIIVPNAAEVVLQGRMNSHDAVITLGFKQGDPFTIGDLESLLTHVEDWWTTYLAPIVTEAWNMPAMKAYSLESESAPVVTDTDFTPHNGTSESEPVPDNVAMVVSFSTNKRGRSYRGRNFVPGLGGDALANPSQWTSGTVTAFTAAYAGIATVFNPTVFEHCVISRFHNHEARLFGETEPVTGYLARQKIGTMRRRVLGSGS